MEQEKTNSKYLEAELYQPDPFLRSQYLRKDANRRHGLQSRAWKHALLVAISTALIFLVVKCTMQLAPNKATSVRKLAENFPWRRSAGRPLLQVSEFEEGACTDPKKTRVHHKTTLTIGESSSVLYRHVKQPYKFPLIGREARYERLRQVLEKVEEVADGLCFLHQGPYNNYVRADYTPSGGEQGLHIYILIRERTYRNESGFSQLKRAFSSRKSRDNRHFRRDAAIITEEMVCKILAEIDEKGGGHIGKQLYRWTSFVDTFSYYLPTPRTTVYF